MKEFMLYIRNLGDNFSKLSSQQQQDFLEACRVYINHLKEEGHLIGAQPMDRQGKMVTGSANTSFKEGPYNEGPEVIVGYYHILAKDLDEAVTIAKQNPEFAFSTTARIEVRPIKMKEESTGFEYPKEKMKM
jgi:hypothetical protein